MNMYLAKISTMKNLLLSLLFCLICGLVACNSGGEGNAADGSSASGKSLLSPKQFQAKIDELDNELLIDLRSHAELHSIGPIARAINLDFNAGRFEQMMGRFKKEQPIMVYCASGGRSAKATNMLKEAGFDVYDLDSGIEGWQAAGLPIQAHSHHHH